MCRLAAHLGQPVALSTLLYDPPRSLEVLAHSPREMTTGVVNVDGTGVVWWPEPGRPPLRYATDRTPWADANLPGLAPRLIGSPIVAAVRSATPGIPIGVDAVAPFVGDGLGFTHNGWIAGFGTGVRGRLEQHVDDDVHHATRAVSDSLVVFGLVRTRVRAGEDLPDAVAGALGTVARVCREAGEQALLNVVVTDGVHLVATRTSVDRPGNSLYTHVASTGWQVASEPLDPDEDWQPVPDASLLVASPDGAVRHALAL